MKRNNPNILKSLAITLFMVAAMALATVRPAQATLGGTSAGATIHNVVQVTYKLSSTSAATNVYSSVDVTVLTVPTTPTWYASTGQITTGGSVVNYVTTLLRSNANGPDGYTLTQSNGTATNADDQTSQSITTTSPLTLWGGIVTVAGATSGSGNEGTIGFPGGSIATAIPVGSLAVNDTVEILTGSGLKRYIVTVITAGTKNTQATGLPSNETPDVVTLTPVSGLATDRIGTVSVTVGTQVGEYAIVNFELTAGNPTLPGTPGTNVTNLNAQGAATDAAGATASAAATSVTTTITSSNLTISKKSRIRNAGSLIPGVTSIDPGNYDNAVKTAKFGQIIEYLITVTNPSGNSAANSVVITDPIPAYTTVVAGSQSTGTTTISGTVAAGTVTAAGDEVWDATPRDFGPLAGNTDLLIVYQVTVN